MSSLANAISENTRAVERREAKGGREGKRCFVSKQVTYFSSSSSSFHSLTLRPIPPPFPFSPFSPLIGAAATERGEMCL